MQKSGKDFMYKNYVEESVKIKRTNFSKMFSSDYIDYYAVLSLPQHANAEEVRRAYRKKVMDCHPDLYPEDPEKLRLFNTVKEAYETLTHPQKKEIFLQERWRRKAGGLSVEGKVFSPSVYLKQCLAMNRQLAAMDVYRISEQQIIQQLSHLLSKDKMAALKEAKDPLMVSAVVEALLPCTRFLSLQPLRTIADVLMNVSGDDPRLQQKINKLIAEKKREHRQSFWKIPFIIFLTVLLCLLMYWI
ncbi:MAG: J domain-containing protein [Bacteroidota bacterium]|jgi:hypothetical protein